MTTRKNAGDPMDRADLAHAVSTLGAACRSLSRIKGYEVVHAEAEQVLEYITEELRVIREKEKNGKSTGN